MKPLRAWILAWPALAAAAVAPAPTPIPPSVRIERDLPYGPYRQNLLDVLSPAAPAVGLRTGIVVVHGGGWSAGSREKVVKEICLPYVQRGCVVCNVEYRLLGVAPAPAAVIDGRRAAQWFFEHAAQYHVDPKRIVMTGNSAGGHLALMIGLAPTSKEFGPLMPFAAIVNCWGVTDVTALLSPPQFRSYAADWVPDQPGRAELARRVSPLSYVRPGLPPILTLHGEEDPTVPPDQAHRLTAALQAAGDETELVIMPHTQHGPVGYGWDKVREQAFSFLRRHGLLE